MFIYLARLCSPKGYPGAEGNLQATKDTMCGIYFLQVFQDETQSVPRRDKVRKIKVVVYDTDFFTEHLLYNLR